MNVVVAQMTLAPRFAFLWQRFVEITAAVAAHQTTAGAPPAPAEALRWPSPAHATETLIERIRRIFLSRPTTGPAAPRPRSHPTTAQRRRASDFGPARIFARPRLVSVPPGNGHHADAPLASAPFRGGHLRFAAPRVAELAEATLRRTAEVLCTTVMRRVHCHLAEIAATAPVTAPTARQPAPSPAHREPPPSASVALPPRAPHVPAERRFRADPAPSPTPAPALHAPPRPRAPEPSPAPEIDIAKLDRVLWQRFEKRVRIEQERRGRR